MINGQILQNSKRATLISNILKKYSCKTIVEIGTWKGMGSTLCILKSMEDSAEFISIESNETFYKIACSNLENYADKVKLIHGTIVTEQEIINYTKDIPLDDVKKEWLKEDIENVKLCPNAINTLPEKIDFLLLDGGEFSTYQEWIKLKDRTFITAIDDINELKTQKIYKNVIKDENFEILCKTDEGNGFCIFKNKQYNGLSSIK
jgi:tRNA A58 N-methylase Trm61